MILLSRTIVLHVPGTGGGWATEAMQNAGLDPRVVGDRHGTLPARDRARDMWLQKYPNVICFVRHPLELASYRWSMGRSLGDGLEALWCQTFDGFARTLIDHPGCVGRWLRGWTQYATLIAHQEDLAVELAECLVKSGEQFDADALAATPRINARSIARRPIWRQDLLSAFLEAEKDAVKRYGYDRNAA